MPYSPTPSLSTILGVVIPCKVHSISGVYSANVIERWETTNLTISYNTPLEIMEKLKSRLRQYTNENNRDWAGFDMNIDKMEFQNSISLILAIQRDCFHLTSFIQTLTPYLEPQIVRTGKTGGAAGAAEHHSCDISNRFWRTLM